MLEYEMKINQLEEENMELKNRIKLLERDLESCKELMGIHNVITSNKDIYEDKPSEYDEWLESKEAKAMEQAYKDAENEANGFRYEEQVACLG